MNPSQLIYDLIIEKAEPPYHRLRVFIKFQHSPGYGWHPRIVHCTHVNNSPPPMGATVTNTEIFSALRRLYWAMTHDPEPPSTEIIKFFKTLNL